MTNPIITAVDRTTLRLRFARALDGAVIGGIVALTILTPTLVLAKLGWVTPLNLFRVAAVLPVLPLCGAVIGAARRVSRLRVAVALDRGNALDDRLANAWEILSLPDDRRTPFMRLHLERTLAGALAIDVARAAPIRVPRDTIWLGVAALVAALVASLAPTLDETADEEVPQAAEPARVVTAETSFERERLDRLRARAEVLESPVVDTIVSMLTDVLDSVERGADDLEIHRALAAIDRQIEAATAHRSTGDVEAVQAPDSAPSPTGSDAPAPTVARGQEQLERDAAEERALDEASRRADSLREMLQRRGNAAGDPQERAENMRQFLDRAQGRDGDDEQAPGGDGAAEGTSDGSTPDDDGRTGSESRASRGDDGGAGGGSERASAGGGDPDGAGGDAADRARRLRDESTPTGQGDSAARDGRQLEQLQRDRPESQGSEGGAGTNGADGGAPSPGRGIGREHVDNTLLDPTEIDGVRSATRARTHDSGEGASVADVIEGAAAGGFATTRYRDVYQNYERVAEEVMERDRIPSGYRFYVRRYFELISPRD